MKKLFIPVALVLASSLLATSCKKKEDDPSRAQMITGTWKLTQEGEDTNGNGTWEDSERTAAADQATATFNADGTGTTSGTVSGIPISFPFNWRLQNNDNDIRIITTILGSTDTSVNNIVTVTSSDFVVRDMSASPVSYTAFKKQ
jgi:hypothetical protein